MKRHESLIPEILDVLTAFGKENLEDLFEVYLRRQLPEGHGFYKFTHSYLGQLVTNPLTKQYIEQNKVLAGWIERAVRFAEIKASNSTETNIYSTFMLVDLWISFDNKIEKIIPHAKERIFGSFEAIV